MSKSKSIVAVSFAIFALLIGGLAHTQMPTGPMSFFVTSDGSGRGGDLGGLEGADRICQTLAKSVDQGHLTWRAYLSTQGPDVVNARDRIGKGPWFNTDGVQIAANLDELHSDLHRVSAFNATDERGRLIPYSGFYPNRHDILTGTQADGTAYPPGEDMTCSNWTSSSDDNKARVGHHDFADWNSAHNSRGCSQEALIATAGDGLFYCFALLD